MKNKKEAKKFKVHWLSGNDSIIEGINIVDAFCNEGYSANAAKVIDWFEEVAK